MVYSLNFRISGNQLLFKFLCFFIALNLSSAYADEFDTFNVVVGSNYTHDSNLFKLPSGAQPAVSGAERSDNILRNSIGFKLDKKYSLQEFKVTFDHVDTRYDNAKFLDFKGNNYNAVWLWALTPRLTGLLSADRKVSLVPFQDFRNGFNQNATATQIIRTSEMKIFSLDYSPFGNWHLIGAYNKLISDNSQTFLPETSFELESVQGGLKYGFPSASYISLTTKNSQGKNQEINNANLIGKDFEEQQEELTAFWDVTGKSKILANIGHIERMDDSFQVRDFSGMFGGINYTWDVTGKTSISMGVSRKLSAFQTQFDSYSVSDILFINPTWYATSKIKVSANAQVGRRAYKGEGNLPSASNRVDDTLSYGVGVDWSPRSTIKLGLNLQRDERNSSSSNFDYSANVASINGLLTF